MCVLRTEKKMKSVRQNREEKGKLDWYRTKKNNVMQIIEGNTQLYCFFETFFLRFISNNWFWLQYYTTMLIAIYTNI